MKRKIIKLNFGHQNSRPQTLISTALLTFVAGALYAWSALIPALENAFEIETRDAGMVFSLAIVTFTVSGLIAPRLPAAFRGLRGGAIASVAAGIVLALAAAAPNFQVFLIAYSLGFGGASGAVYFMGLEVAGATKNPKLFTAILVASFGFGGVVFGPAFRLLVVADWGMATLYVPAFGMVLAAAYAFLVLSKSGNLASADAPLLTEELAEATSAPAPDERPVSARIIVLFWATMATGSVAGLMTLGLATTVIESQGGSILLSSLALSGIAIGNTGGRLIIGAIPKRVPIGWLVASASVGSVFGLLVSVFASSPAITAAGMILVATGYGTVASGIPVLTQMVFGTDRFGRVYSIIFTAWGVAGLISPWLAGALFDTYGNFSAAFFLAAGASAISFVLLLRIKRETDEASLIHAPAPVIND